MKRNIVLFLLPFIVFLFYSNIWYLSDDFEHLRVFSGPVETVFKNVITGNSYLEHNDNHYRPLNQFILALDLKAGSPYFSHFFALLIHYINGLLIFVLLRKYFTFNISLFGFYFFLFNPVINTSIFWISALNDLLVTLFSLLVLYYFLRYSNEKQTKGAVFLTVFFFWCSLFSKEMSVTLPLILTLISFKSRNLQRTKNVLALLWISLVLFICLRTAVLGHLLMGNADAHYFTMGKSTVLSLLKYIYCFLIPTPIFINREFPIAYATILPLIVMISLWLKQHWSIKALNEIIFYFILFIISLLPIINVFSTWYMYFPSVVFTAFICYVVSNVKLPVRKILLSSYCAFFIIVMSYWAYLYNKSGNFNKTFLDVLKQFDQKTINLVNIPSSAYSNIPLITNQHFMEAAIWFSQKKDVTVEYTACRMVNDLPKQINISKVSDNILNLHSNQKEHDYYQLKYQDYKISSLKDIKVNRTDVYNNPNDITVYLASSENALLVEP